jgi:hypothetical protein
MSYQPPHKRNTIASEKTNERNIFKSSLDEEKEESAPEFEMKEELFPSLNTKEVGVETTTTSMDFASSLFKKMPKKKEIKDIEDGWVRILPGKRYVYGKKSKDFKEVKRLVQYRQWLKREDALDKILERYERFYAMELFLNGPKHYTNFELQEHLEKEKKLKQASESQDESTTDDDYESGHE